MTTSTSTSTFTVNNILNNTLNEIAESRDFIEREWVAADGGSTWAAGDALSVLNALERILCVQHETTRISQLFRWLTGKNLVDQKGRPLPERERKDLLWQVRFDHVTGTEEACDMAIQYVEAWLGY